MADLLLWRHAEAEAGYPDASRVLTPHGESQANASAAWLLAHMPKDTQILVSPAVRTQQTAMALGLAFKTEASLSTAHNAADLLDLVNWPNSTTPTLIIGHQPTLGEAACFIMTGEYGSWAVKKSAIWWISSRHRAGHAQYLLKAVINPETLKI